VSAKLFGWRIFILLPKGKDSKQLAPFPAFLRVKLRYPPPMRWLIFLAPLILASCAINTGRFVSKENQTRLPDLYEHDQYNRLVSLRDYGAQDYLLVFFYPEADTPG
jgi:hypothetical protein